MRRLATPFAEGRRRFLAAAVLGVLPAYAETRSQRVVFVNGPGRHGTPEELERQRKRHLELFAEEGFVSGPAFSLEMIGAGSAVEAELDAFARRVVATNPALVLVSGDVALHFRKATSRIPIVFYAVGMDPVRMGLVASMARPGGNVTGTSVVTPGEEEQKGWELLKELVPRAKRVGILWYEDEVADPQYAANRRPFEATANRLGLKIVDIVITRDIGIRALERAVRDSRVDFLDAAGLDEGLGTPEVMGMLERRRVPALWFHAGHVRAGGLVSTGASMTEAYREAFKMAALILRGADPATLPVRTPRRVITAINLRTARAMGLAVPESVLLRADVVVE